MTDPDQRDTARLEDPMQPMAAGTGQCRQRQRRILGRGRHRAKLEAPTAGDLLLEGYAFGRRAFDEDMDEARAHGLADQPIDLDPRHAEPAGDLFLGLVTHIGEPCRTRGEAEIVCLQHRPP